MQIHHLHPDAEGGSGDFENGIPVCLNCHAEIESESNMGRKFSHEELKILRDEWFATVRDRPEVLLKAAQTQTETGPLEALMAELDFNRVAVLRNIHEPCPPLQDAQFRRAVATNSLAALPTDVREAVQYVYVLIMRINYLLDVMARMRSVEYTNEQKQRDKLRTETSGAIPPVIRSLEAVLGLRDESTVGPLPKL